MFSVLPIYYIGIVQAFFVALLLSKKNRKSYADLILMVWLVVIGLEMLYSLLNLTVVPNLPDLIVIPFAYGPFLFFYTKNIIADKPVRLKNNLMHFAPVLVLAILSLVWKGGQSITTINWFGQGSKMYLSFLDYLLFIASMFGYWLIVFRKINAYQKKIAHQLSFQNTAVRLNWLKNIAWWILGAFILSGVTYGLFIGQNIYPFNPIAIYHAGLLMFVFSISYYGINQTSVKSFNNGVNSVKKSNAEFDETEMAEFRHQIGKYMTQNKPYLKGELTLQDLADELGTSVQKISHFLNHYLQRNFFNYINEYRVKEATERIKNPENKNLTLLAIGYDSGFNSKSSFNSLFKKHTGFTPSEYQKKHLK